MTTNDTGPRRTIAPDAPRPLGWRWYVDGFGEALRSSELWRETFRAWWPIAAAIVCNVLAFALGQRTTGPWHAHALEVIGAVVLVGACVGNAAARGHAERRLAWAEERIEAMKARVRVGVEPAIDDTGCQETEGDEEAPPPNAALIALMRGDYPKDKEP